MRASRGVCVIVLAGASALASACAKQGMQASPEVGRTSAEISASDLKARLYIYADDSMMGREAGTPGSVKATAYLAAEAARLGLEPGGDNGTYFQDARMASPRLSGATIPGSTRNVIAILRGSDPTLRDEYVAIGAHSDHVGVRPAAVDHDSLRFYNVELTRLGAPVWDRTSSARRDSLRATIEVNLDSLRRVRPARRDSISNGADDDGSGSVALLEIAEALTRASVKPKRSVIFVWHNAEEKGLLGAKWFTDNLTIPRGQIVAQLNMDMVGRGGADDIAGGGPAYVQLIGSRRVSTELGDIVEQINSQRTAPFAFDYQYDANGHPERLYCRSDHYMYARYGIPVTFITTGLHADYHQVTDEPQYIEYDKLARVAGFVRDVAVHVANLDHRPKVDKPAGDPAATCVQ